MTVGQAATSHSLAEPHPRAQAARGSALLYHSCRISAVQSDFVTGHTLRFMLHPPRIEQAKQPIRGPLNLRQMSTLMVVRLRKMMDAFCILEIAKVLAAGGSFVCRTVTVFMRAC